jgi:hypothetical protein
MAPDFPHRQSNGSAAAFVKVHVASDQRLSLTLCGLFLAGAEPRGRFKGYRAPSVISGPGLRALDVRSACQVCLHKLGRL